MKISLILNKPNWALKTRPWTRPTGIPTNRLASSQAGPLTNVTLRARVSSLSAALAVAARGWGRNVAPSPSRPTSPPASRGHIQGCRERGTCGTLGRPMPASVCKVRFGLPGEFLETEWQRAWRPSTLGLHYFTFHSVPAVPGLWGRSALARSSSRAHHKKGQRPRGFGWHSYALFPGGWLPEQKKEVREISFGCPTSSANDHFSATNTTSSWELQNQTSSRKKKRSGNRTWGRGKIISTVKPRYSEVPRDVKKGRNSGVSK